MSRPTVTEPIVRVPEIGELEKICQLARKCYGDTHNEFIYDAQAMADAYAEGSYIPIIGEDPGSGALIGHLCLMRHEWTSMVPVIELAFIDHEYRCPGLSMKLGAKVKAVAADLQVPGLMDFCVTTHKMSQKATKMIDMMPCSMFMNLIPQGLDAQQMLTTGQKKGTSINYYQAYDHSPMTVYPPEKHQAMIEEIYGWLDLPRTYASGNRGALPKKADLVLRHSPHQRENISDILIKSDGADLEEQLKHALEECRGYNRDSIFIFAPLASPSAPHIHDVAAALGFSFSGIMPHVAQGKDSFFMQWLRDPIQMTAIQTYGDEGRRLYDYVLDCMIDTLMQRSSAQ
ncbi:MAG: hypothetical protein JW739_02090 [Opitutales bacterium]|nr:hypothetical protein [Opitutales bacterium]